MASGSSSKPPEKTGGEPGRHRPGPWPPKIEPFVPNTDHNPRELKSWAKRTGFHFSGEAEASGRSGVDVADAEKRRNGSSPKIEIDPILGKSKGRSEDEGEIGLAAVNGNVVDGSGKRDGAGGNGVHEGKAAVVVAPLPEAKDPTKGERDVEIDMFSSEPEPDNLLQRRYSGTRLKYSLQDKPGPG